MATLVLGCAGLAASGALLGAPPPDAAPAARVVERLTDALVTMLPLGRVLADAAGKDPTWPFQGSSGAATASQLACVRGELSEAGYRRGRKVEAEAYARAHPRSVEHDVALLDDGAAALFGQIMLDGVASAAGGPPADPDAVMKAASSEQVLSLVTFVTDPAHADLRKLSGYEAALDTSRSAEDNRKSGEQLGQSLVAQLMLKAMVTCDVPPSVYL